MVITLMKQHQEDRLAIILPMQAILSILVESTELRL